MDLDALKKTPIALFCTQNLGYTVDKKHDSKLCRTLISPCGEKILTRSTPNSNGHYLFKSTTSDAGGTLIDLLLKVEQKTWAEINDIFSYDLGCLSTKKNADISPQESTYLTAEEVREKTRLISSPNNYLTSRGISSATLDDFGLQAARYHAFFPLKILQKGELKTVGAIKYYMSYGQSRKRFIGKKGASFSLLSPLKKKEGNVSLLIFESPVDALSFWQIYKKGLLKGNYIFLSLCGRPSKVFLQNFSKIIDYFNANKVVYALDADNGGHEIYKLLKKYVNSSLNTVRILPPARHKDWNDVLEGLDIDI